MAIGSPQERRTDGIQRRKGRERASRDAIHCVVSSCGEAAAVVCSRCSRPVCERHAGVGQVERLTAPRAERRRTDGALPRLSRCAQCRLEDLRRGQMTMRRAWWGISAMGFALFIAIAFKSNHALGIALTALTLVLLVVAYVYDRSLRRK